MPDFGLTEALSKALAAAREVPVLRPAEQKLAASAAKSAPAAVAPAVPGALPNGVVDTVHAEPSVQTPSAITPPDAVQAPAINPSQPPADVLPPQPDQAAATDTAAVAPPDITPQAADATPPEGNGQPVPPEPTVAPQTSPEPTAIDPAAKLPLPVTEPTAISPDVQTEATKYVTANLGALGERADLAHMPNVNTLQGPDGFRAAVVQVAQDNADAISKASRGTVPDAQFIALAQQLSTNVDTVKQVLGRVVGTNLATPEVAAAARLIVTNETGKLVALSAKIADGSATSAEVAQWEQQRQLTSAFITQAQGAKAEAGRTMRGLGLQLPDAMPPEVMDHIAQVLKQNNPNMQATAAAIKLAMSPGGVANIISGMQAVPLWQRAPLAAWDLTRRVFINGILSGPPTWVTIFTGNNFNVALNSADLYTAAIGRGIYGLATRMGRFPTAAEGVQMSDAIAHIHGVVSGGADALRVAGRVMKTGQSMDTIMRSQEGGGNSARQSIIGMVPELQDTYFGGIVKVIDSIIDAPGARIIAPIDDFTKTLGYRGYATMMALKDVRARITAGSLKPGDAEAAMVEMMNNASPEIQQASEDWAHRMTFQTPFPEGGRGEAFQAFLNKAPELRFIFPFMRTATNIFKQSLIERTPLAVFSARLRSQIMNGGFEGDLAKSRIATGTAIGSMLAWMAIHDRITGDAPKDAKERLLWEADGRTANSVRITDPITGKDTWRDYHKFEPLATVASAVADAVKLHSYVAGGDDVDTLMPHEEKMQDIVSHIMASIIQNTGNKTFMQGAAQFSEMYNDPQRAFGMWADQTGADLVPFSGALKFVRNIQDPFMRQAFSLMDKIRDELPTFGGIKGSKTLAARLDVFGQPRTHAGANSIIGPLSPLPGSPSEKDPVTDEVQSLMDQTRTVPLTMPSKLMAYLGSGKGLQDGQGMRLTPEEYSDYVRMSRADPVKAFNGLTLREKLNDVIQNDKNYADSTPAEKVGILGHLESVADKNGRQRLWEENQDFQQRMTAWTAEKNRLKFNQ